MKHISLLERLLVPKAARRPKAPPIAEAEESMPAKPHLQFRGTRGSIYYPFADTAGAHWLCGGATGCGKSRFVAGLAMQHIRAFAKSGAPGLVLLDPKSETVDLLLRLIANELRQWRKEEQERVLSTLLVIAPCRKEAGITPLQLLHASPDEAESRAAEVSEALVQGVEADLGVLQEGALANVLALAIESGEDLSLVELPHLLASEPLVRQMAVKSKLALPRTYVLSGRFGKEASQRIAGIQARIEKLLRIERLRLALGAPALLDLRDCFRGRITLIDLGSDYGAEEATRIIGRLLFSRLVASLFSQPPEALQPTLLICEEFPDLVGKGLGAKTEKLFAQARSRKTGCMILFQAPTQLQSGGLLRVLVANARLTILGQMPEAEARFFEELLPSTGTVQRRPEPGEVLPKSPYLSPSEERTFRLAEVAHLERGVFFFSDRSRRQDTSLVRADNCSPPSWDELSRELPPELLARVKSGFSFLSRDEAEASYASRMEHLLARIAASVLPAGPPAQVRNPGFSAMAGTGEFTPPPGEAANRARPPQPGSRRSRRRKGELP